MKKIFYISLVCLLTVACQPKFEDLFDKTATERLEQRIDEAVNTLTASEKGWIMEYFQTTNTRGYVLFAKFNTGTVTLGNYNENKAIVETSSYSTDFSQGPVINFDTYSDALHTYCNPDPTSGRGVYGDFEFSIVDISDNQVILKGKKYDAKIILNKIDGDEPMEALWEDYYKKSQEATSAAFSNNDGFIYNFKTGDKITVATYNNYTFSFTNPDESVDSYGIITQPTGFRLQKGIPVGDKLAENFIITEDKNTMLCIDEGVDAQFYTSLTALEYLQQQLSKSLWTVNTTTMSESAQEVYNEFVTKVTATGATIGKVELYYNTTTSEYYFNILYRIGSKDYYGIFYGDIAFTETTMQFIYTRASNDGLALLRRAGGGNADTGKALIFDSLFGKIYTVSSDWGGTLNFNILRLTDAENSDFYYTIKK